MLKDGSEERRRSLLGAIVGDFALWWRGKSVWQRTVWTVGIVSLIGTTVWGAHEKLAAFEEAYRPLPAHLAEVRAMAEGTKGSVDSLGRHVLHLDSSIVHEDHRMSLIEARQERQDSALRRIEEGVRANLRAAQQGRCWAKAAARHEDGFGCP